LAIATASIALRTAPPSRSGRPPLRAPFEVAGGQARAERDRRVHLILGEPMIFAGRDGRAEDAEDDPGVKAARPSRSGMKSAAIRSITS
jgi:hypothetical protein